jgi:LmbE family N-acetylglucosaminyl deacetylase
VSRIAVVSPHLDDAVLSCGAWLAAQSHASVITVFAGAPPGDSPLTDWDAACGFTSTGSVISSRRAEDAAALSVLDCTPIWLDFLDDQYGDRPAAREVAQALDAAVTAIGATTVVGPLGLFHADHQLTHHACLQLLARYDWLFYADVPYRSFSGDELEERLAALVRHGWAVERLPPLDADATKRAAVACYSSQIRGLCGPNGPGLDDSWQPEELYHLSAIS